jgi:hypothetical protein
VRPHPYLRAYMAGIVGPTLFLLVTSAFDAYHRYYFEVPSQFVLGLPALPLHRAFLFPMAIVPNAWGLWNMLYLAVRGRARLPLGVFGALLVLLLIPGGALLARTLDAFAIQLQFAVPMVPIGMGVYYLAWKYLVGFLNQELGIA